MGWIPAFLGITYTAVAVFGMALTIDYSYSQMIIAIEKRWPHRAAQWSVVMWAASTLCLYIAVEVSFLYLPLEAVGLYLGTWWAVLSERSETGDPTPQTGHRSVCQSGSGGCDDVWRSS